MRHTAFLVLGTDSNNICADIKKYVMMYGEGNTDDYFQVINWNCQNGLHTAMFAQREDANEQEFCSSIKDEFYIKLKNAEEMRTEEEVAHFFSVLYDRTVTIRNQGDCHSLHLTILLPLYNSELCTEAILIVKLLDKIRQSYVVDVIGFSDDMAYLFSCKDELNNLPSNHKKNKENVIKTCEEIKELKSSSKHRFIMMQNHNSKGVSLDLNQDSITGILGEYALICIENYNTIFPISEESEQCEVCAIGLSVLSLDRYYFVDYLLKKAYLKVLSRENVTQKEVDINKVSQVAQNSLNGRTNLFSDFYDQHVVPLIKQGKSEENIIAEITPKLDEEIAILSQEIQSFINKKDLSLPEKQASLAQILGTDDKLLKGYQYNKSQLTIDDCDSEAVNLFITENNKLIKREKDENGDVIITPSVLRSPCDKEGNVYLPLEQLKNLRSKIKESTNYIREKSKELDELQNQLKKDEKSQIRLTENGFVYGNSTYKLLDVKEKPLQDNYEPNVTPKNAVDLRQYFTEIKDQGNLGTCSVFSLVSIYEYILKKTNREHDLSERFVYYNVLNDAGCIDDTGSSLYGVVESITKYGTCLEEFCKYDIAQYQLAPSVEAYTNAETHKIKCAKNIKVNRTDIMSALSEGYPIAISLKIYDSFGINNNGFVFRPSDEEIEEGKYGNHAMVICGYSTDDKVYIVRNSWGKDFGDKGYCYIPFSYIEDSNFTNSACIITSINEGEEVKGSNQQTFVPFNKTDREIRYSIIRILVDEEKIELAENKDKYGNLRIDYEALVQTLCNNSKRNELIEKTRNRIKNEIENDENSYNSFVDTERRNKLNEYKRNGRSIFYTMVAFSFALATTWGICVTQVENWMTNDWNWILIGALITTILTIIGYWSFKRHHYRVLKNEMEECAQQKAANLNKKKIECNSIQLRLYIAGMIIDRLNVLQKELHDKYTLMKSYVGNLSIWYDEEQRKIQDMEPLSKEPFLPLLNNKILENYFENNGEYLTEGLYLYEFLNKYELSEKGIKEYKTDIKKKLIQILNKPLNEFKLLAYIQNDNLYLYLDKTYSDITTLLPLLERKGGYFLQTRITEIDRINDVSKCLFINQETQNERNRWNQEFPKFFQKRPNTETISSPYKLVVLQKANLNMDSVVI